MSTAPSPLGSLGKYTLVRKLAVGGMAEVFLARADGPMGFAKKCVVKRILPHFNDDQRFIEMFLGEARLAAELNHPNLVQIFDFGQHNGQYFIAMEFIDGPNTRVLNQACRRELGAMDFGTAARIISLAAEGLHYAHELRDEHGTFLNLVHRDISPDNILVSRSGAVKVVDFGIAKASTQPHLTKSGMIKGKMAYMPPEQLAREPLDRRADLFALGIVLYELITGGMPFDATSEVSIIQAIMSVKPLERATVYRPDCPPALEAIVTRCLEKDREKRYPSCRELQGDLEKFIQSTGKAVGTREIGALVEQLMPPEPAAPKTGPGVDDPSRSGPRPQLPVGMDRPTRPSSDTLDKTDLSKAAVVMPDGEPHVTGTGMSGTALRSVVDRPAVQRSKAPIIAVVVVLALVGAAGGAWYFRSPPEPAGVVDAGTPRVEVIDAGRAVLPAVVVDASVELDEDAGAAVEAEDAGAPPGPEDAGTKSVAPAKTTGKLSLRIRPYATVYLDDKLLGDTPLPPQTVATGKHKLKLVNPSLGTITLDVTIKPGDNVIKHNFKE
ncbi:MAG: serine/threonine-protein kinase [Myxococcaceae bacterium]